MYTPITCIQNLDNYIAIPFIFRITSAALLSIIPQNMCASSSPGLLSLIQSHRTWKNLKLIKKKVVQKFATIESSFQFNQIKFIGRKHLLNQKRAFSRKKYRITQEGRFIRIAKKIFFCSFISTLPCKILQLLRHSTTALH